MKWIEVREGLIANGCYISLSNILHKEAAKFDPAVVLSSAESLISLNSIQITIRQLDGHQITVVRGDYITTSK